MTSANFGRGTRKLFSTARIKSASDVVRGKSIAKVLLAQSGSDVFCSGRTHLLTVSGTSTVRVGSFSFVVRSMSSTVNCPCFFGFAPFLRRANGRARRNRDRVDDKQSAFYSRLKISNRKVIFRSCHVSVSPILPDPGTCNIKADGADQNLLTCVCGLEKPGVPTGQWCCSLLQSGSRSDSNPSDTRTARRIRS